MCWLSVERKTRREGERWRGKRERTEFKVISFLSWCFSSSSSSSSWARRTERAAVGWFTFCETGAIRLSRKKERKMDEREEKRVKRRRENNVGGLERKGNRGLPC